MKVVSLNEYNKVKGYLSAREQSIAVDGLCLYTAELEEELKVMKARAKLMLDEFTRYQTTMGNIITMSSLELLGDKLCEY
tara:strand:+ start:5611 stop:5850 length:240 start_codon:yes stop_codon:yes gene_type:complete